MSAVSSWGTTPVFRVSDCRYLPCYFLLPSIREIRRILAHVRTEVDRQYAGKKDLKALRFQGVIALIFLRLVVPAILDPRKHLITHGAHHIASFRTLLLIHQRFPHLICLTKGTPNPLVRRSLTQIAKIIQALANMNQPTAKVIERLMFTAHFVST